MHRGLIRVGAAVLALTVALAGSPAKAAVVDPVHPGQWTVPQCAAGVFTSARSIQPSVQVLGTATACGKHVDGALFAVGVYHLGVPGAVPFATVEDSRYYYKDRPRDFAIEIFSGAGTETVCLLAGHEKRLACADITATAAGTVTMRPRRTDDPAVARPVKFGLHDPIGDQDDKPSCATCF